MRRANAARPASSNDKCDLAALSSAQREGRDALLIADFPYIHGLRVLPPAFHIIPPSSLACLATQAYFGARSKTGARAGRISSSDSRKSVECGSLRSASLKLQKSDPDVAQQNWRTSSRVDFYHTQSQDYPVPYSDIIVHHSFHSLFVT